ncbi:hypothetical protein LIER_24272 [Lithospermum erythrorhizon]|uniref:Uncharacterized protein n=1 Tax=Lithospermum erythrorhizon TaxID=34254 RepID=A0AAV3R1Z6_LITER
MSHTGSTQPGTDQVAAGGGVNQTNNPAALTIANSFNSCSALKGSTSLGVLASNRSAAHGAQFEVVSGGAEATVCAGNGNIYEVKAQLTRKSPVAAKNAEKHEEATEKRSALPPVNTPTSRADLVEKEGRKLVQIVDSLEEAEAHIGGAVIDDDQHTKDGQIVGPSTAQVIEKG